jgi:hypothetical protein
MSEERVGIGLIESVTGSFARAVSDHPALGLAHWRC